MPPGRAIPGPPRLCAAARLLLSSFHAAEAAQPSPVKGLCTGHSRSKRQQSHPATLRSLNNQACQGVRFPVPISSRVIVLAGFLLLLPACRPENSLNLNSSLWDTEYKARFRRILPKASGSAPISSFRSNNLISRLLASKNLTAVIEDEHRSHFLHSKFLRDVLIKGFGAAQASNMVRLQNCDQTDDPSEIHLHRHKQLHSIAKPFSLQRGLNLLGDMEILAERKQPQTFSELRNQMIQTRKLPSKFEVKQSGSISKKEREDSKDCLTAKFTSF